MQVIKFALGDYCCFVQLNTEKGAKAFEWETQRHCNARTEIHISLLGSCIMDVEDKTYSVSPGQALLIAAGQYHCSKSASENHLHFVVTFSVENENPNKEFGLCSMPVVQLELSDFEVMLCRQIIGEEENEKSFRQESLKAMYTLLLSGIFRKVSCSVTGKEKTIIPDMDSRFGIIDNFFERNLVDYGAEEMLAERLNLSRRQLNRVLKKHYGMCFRDKLRCARMDRAGWLLNTTDMPVSKICEAVGYFSEASFFKAFKAHYGMPPTEYRKNIRNCEKNLQGGNTYV